MKPNPLSRMIFLMVPYMFTPCQERAYASCVSLAASPTSLRRGASNPLSGWSPPTAPGSLLILERSCAARRTGATARVAVRRRMRLDEHVVFHRDDGNLEADQLFDLFETQHVT